MLLNTLRQRVLASDISSDNCNKFLAALDRIERTCFDCNHKLIISKQKLAKIISGFAELLNRAILEWQDVLLQVKKYKSKIDSTMAALNYRVINSQGISADTHRAILRIRASIRQAYNKVTDAITICKNAEVVKKNLSIIEAALAKCNLRLK